jgi:hypothetical protein
MIASHLKTVAESIPAQAGNSLSSTYLLLGLPSVLFPFHFPTKMYKFPFSY